MNILVPQMTDCPSCKSEIFITRETPCGDHPELLASRHECTKCEWIGEEWAGYGDQTVQDHRIEEPRGWAVGPDPLMAANRVLAIPSILNEHFEMGIRATGGLYEYDSKGFLSGCGVAR